MLAVERKNKIREIVTHNKSGTVLELARRFSVSEETIRRDLKQLEEEGLLVRTYGGAYVRDSAQNEVTAEFRENIYVESKKLIAKKCAKLISNGDSIFLDSSTTALYICDNIQDKSVTLITNSLKILNKCSTNKNIQLFAIGGAFSYNTMSFNGRNACKMLQQYHVDKAFISCENLDLEHGLTDSSERQADIRETAINHGTNIYLIADYTKFGKTSFVKISDLSALTGIIVDKPLSSEWNEALNKLNITLY